MNRVEDGNPGLMHAGHGRMEWPPLAESVGRARGEALRFAAAHGASNRLAGDLALCVSEAVALCVLGATASRTPTPVVVELWTTPRGIDGTVTGLQPDRMPTARFSGAEVRLAIIRRAASRCTVRRVRDGRSVIGFHLPSVRPAELHRQPGARRPD